MEKRLRLLLDISPHGRCWVMPRASDGNTVHQPTERSGAVNKDNKTRTVMNVVWGILIVAIASHAIPGFPPLLREYMLLWVIGASLGVFISRIGQ